MRGNYVEDVNIFIKRDDLIEFGLGGNKVRLYEYIAKQAIDNHAEKIITFGSVFSNHIRVTAAVCNLLNIKCDLIILTDEEIKNDNKFPNIRFCRNYHKANIIYCKTSDATAFIDDYQDKQKNAGCRYLWVPGGGHIPLAGFGYVDCSEEMKRQMLSMDVKIDAIFCPCGTGTTQAGLIYGFCEERIPIIGITVARPEERCKIVIADMLKQMNIIRMNPNAPVSPQEIIVLPNSGLSYGGKKTIIDETICNIAHNEGFYLDPIYNAKTFLLMVNYLKKHNNLKNVLYLNTGGTANILI